MSNLEATFIHKVPHNVPSTISRTSSDVPCDIQEKSKNPQLKPNQPPTHLHKNFQKTEVNLRDHTCQIRLGSEKQKEE